MSDVGKRIKLLRKGLGLTQKKLADNAGVSSTSIVYWERNETEPKSKNLSSLARALDCAPDYIMFGATSGNGVSFAPLHSRVPLIGWEDVINLNGGAMDTESVKDWVYCPISCSKGTFALTVSGDAMVSPNADSKSYPSGVIIFVDPDVDTYNGCRVLARIGSTGQATFREYLQDSGVSYLKPINPQYPTLVMDGETSILGVVVGSFSAE